MISWGLKGVGKTREKTSFKKTPYSYLEKIIRGVCSRTLYLFWHYVRRTISPVAVAQCPAPRDDKVEVVNAQFTASEFHHKLGDTLHEVFAPEFDPRR